MNLDSFVNSAVKQVRDSKKEGKVGQKARKEIRKGEQTLEAIKAEIRTIAEACERKEWKETALIMYKTVGVCKCCGEARQVCHGTIHLEKTHKKLGKIITRLENPTNNIYASLPRRVEELEDEHYICADCFMAFDASQLEFEFVKHSLPDCRQKPERLIALFKAEEARYTQMCWNKLLRPYLRPALPFIGA